jgi:hypothetical protein
MRLSTQSIASITLTTAATDSTSDIKDRSITVDTTGSDTVILNTALNPLDRTSTPLRRRNMTVLGQYIHVPQLPGYRHHNSVAAG